MAQTLSIVKNDPWLEPFAEVIHKRHEAVLHKKNNLIKVSGSLKEFASGHLYYGLHKKETGWVFREWAPNATQIFLIGEFNNWEENDSYKLKKLELGNWEIVLSDNQLKDGQLFQLSVNWHGDKGIRLPSYASRCIQDETTKIFSAQTWENRPFNWKHSPLIRIPEHPVIYEAHVGMACEEGKVGSFNEFRENILPRIKEAGYNTIQLMAIQEHPYYGSFGYHVSNFFAVSSRFGTPEELKQLVDEAHKLGLAVIMDLVHSHSVKNLTEGLGKFDGTSNQYFHSDHRREHVAWDSLCFDYGKDQVIHFLLSNCRYWLEEYMFDGFRFDGITSMLYYDHGLSRDFTEYGMYYDGNQDGDAITYLSLANLLIKEVNPKSLSVAEEMSGMPGLAEPFDSGGIGFDYRLAMGTPDYWIKIIKERNDENWDVSEMYYELTSRRTHEKTINYCESHDQALVGDKTIIFRLLDKEMYSHMNKTSQNIIIERGLAIHKMIRLITFATNGGGYLNFMGNEFGHPEWIDFPREGNNWSYHYARRQWSLVDHDELRYHLLADFDRDMLGLLVREDFLKDAFCKLVTNNNADQILAFERGLLLFVFNFNPSQSFTDYGIQSHPGRYKLILNTDSEKYGGFGNIDESVRYYSQRQGGISGQNWLKLYIPSRTGMVFQRIPTPSVY